MAALCSVAPVVAKVPAVSTGKASKSSAMQVWNPTNNKCVSRENSFPVPSRPFRNCTGGAFRDARARATTPRDELRSSK